MSASRIIPKERLGACERLDLAAVVPRLASRAAGCGAQPAGGTREAGHEEGYRAGFQAGLDEGRAAATRLLAQAGALVDSFAGELSRLEQHVATELLELALAAARQVVRGEIAQRPELVREVLCEALRALAGSARDLRVRIHPEDAVLVRPSLEEELPGGSWRLHEDATIERGGCRIETAEAEVDATVGTRWERALALLGEHRDWQG